ncbi:MAG: type II 3-dehydroquinate dehydratase [Caulobacterales bacterium 68-7]|nr:type II 3-dehydroquinate dehydratase [Caulobacterales bacterium]OJU13702.1 MAG: type II 3-dehydroquinate dehydratase [Caulobacterales bacterium 68-7]
MSKPIYVLSGPNLNLLGVREPEIYGYETLEDIRVLCEERAAVFGFEAVCRQSNHEGELVAWIQEARTEASAVVINAAAYTHTSVAILDALKMLKIPTVECHLSNPATREAFRHHSYLSPVVTGVVAGFGSNSYLLAVEAAARLVNAAAAKA